MTPKSNTALAARESALASLCDLRFDNTFVRELPGDPVATNVPRAVRNACYTRVDPTPVAGPRRAALVAARVHGERGDASPRRSDDARALARRHRRAGDSRHVLRRQPTGRARRDRLPRVAFVRALRQFRDSRR